MARKRFGIEVSSVDYIKDSNIVVTGASGFIGAHLVAMLLKEGYSSVTAIISSVISLPKLATVLSLYNLSTSNSSLSIKYADLSYYKDVEEVLSDTDILFHTAAKVDISGDDSLIYDNVLITECVVAAVMKLKIKRLVHISSIATLEPPPYPESCTESMSINTISHKSNYAVSKFYCENIVWRAVSQGVNVTVVHPSVVVGRGAISTGSSSLLDLYSNTLGFYSDGIMGYVSVVDVVRAMVLLAFSPEAAGQKYILSSQNISYKELFSLCASARSKTPPRYKVGNVALSFASTAIAVLHKIGVKLPVSSRAPYLLGEKHLYDGSKITKEFGFVYTPISEVVSSTLKG